MVIQAPDGPAAQQGLLRRGDIVTSIDTVNVRGMSVVHARNIILGPEGTAVCLLHNNDLNMHITYALKDVTSMPGPSSFSKSHFAHSCACHV